MRAVFYTRRTTRITGIQCSILKSLRLFNVNPLTLQILDVTLLMLFCALKTQYLKREVFL